MLLAKLLSTKVVLILVFLKDFNESTGLYDYYFVFKVHLFVTTQVTVSLLSVLIAADLINNTLLHYLRQHFL